MSNIRLILIKKDAAYDVSSIVQDIKWTGRRGSAARSITARFIDDPNQPRADIDVRKGDQCIFSWKSEELFRGMFMKQDQSNTKVLSATAYDNGIYLANNRDTFNYANITAGNVFLDCCNRYGLKYGEIADTKHVIPELVKPKTAAWDAIGESLSLTFEHTGVRYYVSSSRGILNLYERRRNILQWVLEPGVNIIDWKVSCSIDKVKTRIKMISKEGAVVAEAKDEELEKYIGIFQDVESPEEDENEAQLTERVQKTLKEKKDPTVTINVTALGIPEIIAGVGVYTILPDVGLANTFYVEEDTHTFDGNNDTMKLKLSYAMDTV